MLFARKSVQFKLVRVNISKVKALGYCNPIAKVFLFIYFTILQFVVFAQQDSVIEKREHYFSLGYSMFQKTSVINEMNPSLVTRTLIRPQGFSFSYLVRSKLKRTIAIDYIAGALYDQIGAYIKVDTTLFYPVIDEPESPFWFKYDNDRDVVIARGRVVSLFAGAGITKRCILRKGELNLSFHAKVVFTPQQWNGGISKTIDYGDLPASGGVVSFSPDFGEYNDYSASIITSGDIFFLLFSTRLEYQLPIFKQKRKMFVYSELSYSNEAYYSFYFFANRNGNRYIFETESVLNYFQFGICTSL